MLFFESSAKTSYNIDEVFTSSAKDISKKIEAGFYDLSNDTCGIKQGMTVGAATDSVKLDKGKIKAEKKKCC
jgi:hypothetical protein